MTMARRLLPDLTDAKISISVKAKKKKPKIFFRETFYKKAGKKFSEIQVKTDMQKGQKKRGLERHSTPTLRTESPH